MSQPQISHPELVKALVKPGAVIAAEMTPTEADLWHAGTGVIGEAVEILEAHMESMINALPIDTDNILEELGDMEFYIEQTRQNLGVERDETVGMIGMIPSMGGFPESCTLVTVANGLFDNIKKVVVYKKPIDRDKMVSLLTVMEMVMDHIRVEYGLTRDQVLDGNIAKLSVRYAGLTYSNEAAQARADKA